MTAYPTFHSPRTQRAENTHDEKIRVAWRTRCGIALCAFALASASGCITVEGESSGKMQDKLQNSFLYKSARLFYPKGVTGSPEDLPALDRKAVASIEQTYQLVLRGMAKQHAAQHAQIGAVFERPVAERIDARVLVDDAPYARGLPLARMEADGTLRLSSKVAQSLYRTAVLRGMQSEQPGGPRFMDGDIDAFGARAENEREMIDQFNRLMDQVAAAKGRTMLGDMFSALRDDDLKGGWFEMADLAIMSTEVEKAYLAPIRFLVAHEMGHLALGHFSQHPTAAGVVDQELCLRQETEADIYAFALLTTTPEYRHLLDQRVAGLGDSFFLFGYDEFFRSTYDLARFAPPSGAQAAGQCRYESAQQRYDFLERIKRATLERDRNLTLTEMLALKTAPAEPSAGDAP